MVYDPVGDLIIQIKNAGMAKRRVVELPYSRMKYEVASLLAREGYAEKVEKSGEYPKIRLVITLRYINEVSAVTGVKRISKPGLRWYVNKNDIPTVVGGMGIAVLSTSKGIMTGKEAKKIQTGGELLCEIW